MKSCSKIWDLFVKKKECFQYLSNIDVKFKENMDKLVKITIARGLIAASILVVRLGGELVILRRSKANYTAMKILPPQFWFFMGGGNISFALAA